MKNSFSLVSCLLLLAGCSTATSSFNKKVDQFDFTSSIVKGQSFVHSVFENRANQESTTLNVYLGGDGSPWFQGRYITRDPTPLKPVMLELMKMDTGPAIYLGRPCYHQQKMPENCDKQLWSSHRYSGKVVNSMISALKNYVAIHSYQHIRLFGFSGGGTLAVLMAPQLEKVKTVVTIAGNLDIDAWAAQHGYLPLSGSINPSHQPPLPESVTQYHLAGKLDKNISESTIKKYSDRQKNSQYILLPQADHHCCWNSFFSAKKF